MVDSRDLPMVDLKAQYRRIRGDVDAAIARVLESAAFIKGEDCVRLEEEFAAWCGAKAACGVANGTDALTLCLRAYGVGPGDEVVTVANTFIATGEAILLNGARPVFVDVDPVTYTMDAGQLEKAPPSDQATGVDPNYAADIADSRTGLWAVLHPYHRLAELPIGDAPGQSMASSAVRRYDEQVKGYSPRGMREYIGALTETKVDEGVPRPA